MRKLLVIFLTLLFFSSVFGMIQFIPASSASPPPSSGISNSAYVNTTFSGFQNIGSSVTGSSVLKGNQQLKFQDSGAASSQSDGFYWDFNVGTFYYNGSGITGFSGGDIAVPLAYSEAVGAGFGTTGIVVALEMKSSSYVQAATWNVFSGTYTNTVSYLTVTNYYYYVSLSPSNLYLYGKSIPAGTYALSGNISELVPSSSYNNVNGGPQTTTTFTSPTTSSTAPNYAGIGGGGGFWVYSGQSVGASWSIPSGVQAFDFTYSSSQSGTDSSLSSGYYTSSLPTSTTFTQTGNAPVPSYTINWALSDSVSTETSTINSGSLSQSPLENQNWWNSTISKSISPPSSWINGNTVDGKTWPTTLTKYSLSHILSAGYGTNAPIDIMEISGSHSAAYNPPTQYESFTVNPSKPVFWVKS